MTYEIKNIQEAYMGMYSESVLITEELHPEIQSIMNSDTRPSNKLNMVTKKARELIAGGHDTGMESDKPKKGSSRAVFFPKEQKEIHVDGIKTKTPTAVKIAFSGALDKHHGEKTLLGEDQNKLESDHWVNSSYGILQHTPEKGEGHFRSSPDESGGVLAPVFHTHEDHHHLEMGRITPLTSGDTSEATKTKEFPKGLKHDEIQEAMMHEHNSAHGSHRGNSKYTEEHLEKVKTHPWVEHAIDMMHNTGMHPGDLNKRNMGIYTHPVTGKKHLAIIDYGYSREIANKYTKARRNSAAKQY